MNYNETRVLYKRYVDVITLIRKEGQLLPLYMVWESRGDRKLYKIDKVYRIRKAASEVGGCGILYECRIDGKDRNLFYEKDRWFLESYRP